MRNFPQNAGEIFSVLWYYRNMSFKPLFVYHFIEFLTITANFVYIIPKVCFLFLVNMYLVVKSFQSIILFLFRVNVTPIAIKFVFAFCCSGCAKNFFAVLVSQFAKFQIHLQHTLSSVLSKLFC